MKFYLFIILILSCSISYSQPGSASTAGTINIGGVTRTYTIYVPSTYDGSTEVPLIMNLHGLSGSSSTHEAYMDFREIADTANFIVVHPQGEEQSPLPGLYSSPGWGILTGGFASVANGEPDRNFILALLDKMETDYKINSNKIYATGFSQGAFLSNHLALLHNNRFAAIASVAGTIGFEYLSNANLVHATPVLHIHGTSDATISYAGAANFMDADSLVKYWVNYNKCNPVPTMELLPNSNLTDSSTVEHYVYTGGEKGSIVEFYKVIDGGHEVPSDVSTPNYGALAAGGNRNMDFKATEEIWRFFNKYSLDELTSIPENEMGNNSLRVFPNPSYGIFTIELKEYSSAELKVVTILGEELISKNISMGSTSINLEGVAPGIYFYTARFANEIIKSGKLVIN